MSEPEKADDFSAGQSPVFATTHWSVVLKAGEESSKESNAALEKLCRDYWFPLFAYIRRKGHTEEDAKDLTQEFFSRLLEWKSFQKLDARKGKFRTFLLAALGHFLSNQRDFQRAAKRGGGHTPVSLEGIEAEEWYHFDPGSELTPDKFFDKQWAMQVLEKALFRLREELNASGKSAQYEALRQFLTHEPEEGEYGAIAQRLAISKQAVALLVHRLRKRYRQLVRAAIAETVSSPMEVEEEIGYLLEALQF